MLFRSSFDAIKALNHARPSIEKCRFMTVNHPIPAIDSRNSYNADIKLEEKEHDQREEKMPLVYDKRL